MAVATSLNGTDLPGRSTVSGFPMRHLYGLTDGTFTTTFWNVVLTFVGVAQPIDVIPQGSLVRVSLARWRRPPKADRFRRTLLRTAVGMVSLIAAPRLDCSRHTKR